MVIDSTLEPGSLTYGEFVVPGLVDDEVLVSTHVCHPSLCDDNLSGIAVSTMLAASIARRPDAASHAPVHLAPGTIGSITWLHRNRGPRRSDQAGLTLTCLGDEHPFTYKRTARTGTAIDRAAEHVLRVSGVDHQIDRILPLRLRRAPVQFTRVPAPVGSLMRGRHGQFPEYHTSGDDLSFVRPERLVESLGIVMRVLSVVDRNRTYSTSSPKAEPQLGNRGLYRALGGTTSPMPSWRCCGCSTSPTAHELARHRTAVGSVVRLRRRHGRAPRGSRPLAPASR